MIPIVLHPLGAISDSKLNVTDGGSNYFNQLFHLLIILAPLELAQIRSIHSDLIGSKYACSIASFAVNLSL